MRLLVVLAQKILAVIVAIRGTNDDVDVVLVGLRVLWKSDALLDFWDAVDVGNVPAVTFLKASGYQDGHPGYSSPLAEQTFLVDTLNRLQRLPQWKHMAVMISYVTPGGWYDHAMAPIISASSTAYDAVSGPGVCGTPNGSALPGTCGYGMRMPFLLISRLAKVSFVDSTLTDISAVTRFIRENWGLGDLDPDSFDRKAGSLMNMFDSRWRRRAKKLFLDPSTGNPLKR